MFQVKYLHIGEVMISLLLFVKLTVEYKYERIKCLQNDCQIGIS